MELSEKKKAIRKDILQEIKSLPEDYKQSADEAIVKHLLSLPEYRQASSIFCFVGVEHEINTRPFLQQALEDGKILTVPLCTGKGIMEARRIASLEELRRGYYGLYEPDDSSEAVAFEKIDFAVIPCLTADHRGNRLGHGGGYYDILFGRCPDIPAAVICRERIMREELPLEETDHRFAITISENGIERHGEI